MSGKWAEGIVPRHFAWIIKDRLAVCERPGGYGESHRRVRRKEEIIWIRQQGFSRVISLLPSPHNLHAYDELGVEWSHLPFGTGGDPRVVLSELYSELRTRLLDSERLVLHQDEVGDRLQGLVAGYIIYSRLVREEPRAIAMVEQMLARPMGAAGRELISIASELVATGH